ncbi:hypothetical protein GCM10018966_025580 [Streptomyces yanii]
MKFTCFAHERGSFSHVLDLAEIARQLLEEGWRTIDPRRWQHISPYLTEHINRFGEYSPRTSWGIQPEAYDPRCASRRPGRGRFGQAA